MFKELILLKPFLEDPEREFNVREIARILKINPATASKKLKHFSKTKILRYRKERIYDLYKGNLDSDDYKDLKVYYNIRKIKESGIIEKLNRTYLKPAIILFGSCSTGLDVKESDIDLMVISKNKKIFIDKKIEKKLNRKLQIMISEKFSKISNKYLLDSIKDGIVLQGDVDWS